MLNKIIEKHKQKKNEKICNKPTFKIDDLYLGEIVLYKKREDVRFGIIDHHYKQVKKFAFFYKIGYEKYRHILSSQELCELGGYDSIIGDYAVHNIRPFNEVFPIFMRKNNLKKDSRVSLNFIRK